MIGENSTPYDFLDENGKWKCTGCGRCCHFVGDMVEAGKMAKSYDRGDGVCVHLNESGKCDIYEDRPHICRTENYPMEDADRAWMCSILYNQIARQLAKKGE